MEMNLYGKLNDKYVSAMGLIGFSIICMLLFLFLATSNSALEYSFSGCFNVSVTGGYNLTATATSNGTSCINVSASDVNISCNGFTINYGNPSQAAVSHGINISNPTAISNITVTGCSINDSAINGSNSYGINIDGAGVNVTNSDITTRGNDSVHGIFINGANARSTNITNVTITVQGVTTSNGIHVASAPVVMLNSNNITTNASNSYALFFSGAINASGSHNKFTNPTAWINVTTLDGNVSLTNTTYARGANTGNIRFNGTILVNDTNIIDNSVINISVNRSFVDSASYPVFNTTARVSLQGLTMFTNPDELLNDGVQRQCPVAVCTQISFVNGTYIFDVSQWTFYSINEINIVQGTSTPGPISTGGGGGGGGTYDPRYSSAQGAYEAQYGASYFDPSDLAATAEPTTPVVSRSETPVVEPIEDTVSPAEESASVSESDAIDKGDSGEIDKTAEKDKGSMTQKVTKSSKTWLWGLILLVVIIMAGFLYYRNKQNK